MKWLCFVFFTGATLAQDITFPNRVVTFTNLQGTVLKDVTITKMDSGGITWRDGAGGGRTAYTNLPPALLESWGIATNKVEGFKAVTHSARKPEVAPERSLLAAFPQLLWPRAKLEFMFAQRARLEDAFVAGADSDAEAVKLAKEMVAVFKGEDRRVYTEGWKMVGRVHGPSAYFSKTNYTHAGISGEMQLLYDRDQLTCLSFWTDGTDAAFTKLYQLLLRACGSAGKRTVHDKDYAQVEWTIAGTNRYDVDLSHHRWPTLGELDRGVTIFVRRPGVAEDRPQK